MASLKTPHCRQGMATVLILFGSTAFAQQIRLNVGYVGINSDNVIAFIAKETGIFAKNGLDVELVYFGGGSIATMALISGETPITQTAGPGIVNAVLNGSDAVMIAGGVTTLDYWMLSRPEIKTAEQLKGGAVAISRFGSASDFIVRYALQRLGLTPVKEVAILQVGPLPDRLAAMETKRVQATVLAPPAMYMAQKRGYNIIADIAALGLAYQATGVGTTRKFIREHPDVVRRYVKAQVEAVHRFKTDRESSIRVLSKYLKLERTRTSWTKHMRALSPRTNFRPSSIQLLRVSKQSWSRSRMIRKPDQPNRKTLSICGLSKNSMIAAI